MMNPTMSIQRQVEFAETDMAGVVHFSNYMKWMEASEHAYFKSLKAPTIQTFHSGIAGWPKVNISCEYEGTLYFEDVVQINLTVKEIRTHSIRYHFDFIKLEKDCKYPVAHGAMSTVFASINPHDRSIKSMPIDEELLNKMKPHAHKQHTNSAMEY